MEEKFTANSEAVFKATPDQVWEALTDPALVKQWLFGTEMSVSEWKVGGQIRYKGSWEGKTYEDKGEIVGLEPGKILKATYWSSMSGMPDVPENYSLVTYKVEPAGNETKLTITQEGNPTEDSAHHSEGNWKMVLESMRKILEK